MYTKMSSNLAGFSVRLRRILNPKTGRTLIVPFDHGITFGPVPGLKNVKQIVEDAAEAGADAIMLRPGMMNALAEADVRKLGIILCLTGRFDRGIDHVQLNTVEYAIQCGADAVCAEFKFGSDGDLENARLASKIAEEAHQYGLPVLMTIYAISPQVKKLGKGAYAHACRIGEELGADIVKIALPPDQEIISDCVSSVNIPLVVAGGSNIGDQELLESIRTAVSYGIFGAAIGRNIWANQNPVRITTQLLEIIHQTRSL